MKPIPSRRQGPDDRLLARCCRGLACPQEKLDETFLNGVSVSLARNVLLGFLERYGNKIDQKGDGLVDCLHSWTRKAADFETVWDPSFGEIHESLFPDGPPDFLRRAAGLGLRLNGRGMTRSWASRLESPCRLRLGTWLLPLAEKIEVSATQKQLLVVTHHKGSKKRNIFFRRGGQWTARKVEELPWLPMDKQRLILLPPSRRSLLSACQAAIDLVREFAPPYLMWVDRVIRTLLPIRSDGLTNRSGGDPVQPGAVWMSVRTSPLLLAELMVHEAAHQYIHFLGRFGDVDDGSDKTLYYSPIKRKARPIHWILYAYHAVANMLLFYRLCRMNGFPDPRFCLARENALSSHLEQLEKALRTTRALTPLGRAIWKPLQSEVKGDA